jgi:hypothetical protein
MKLAFGLASLAIAATAIALAPTAAAINQSTCPEAVQIHRITGAPLPAECAAFDTPGVPGTPAPRPAP